ncbi:hypothetical protein B0H11DRAFT_2230589 [Mycena galericulata]|nr:hypothetical protein B0H11DRAFT_2230589 [Mycena galericulata]
MLYRTLHDSRRRHAWMILAIVALALLTLMWEWSYSGSSSAKKTGDTVTAKKERVYFRVGNIGTEGLGSTLQHVKQSIVLAHALDAELVFAFSKNRDYSTSRILNGGRDSSDAAVDARNACRIHDVLPPPQRDRIVRGLCGGNETAIAEMQDLKAELGDCTSILDTDETETTTDLNGCIMSWVRARLLAAPPEALQPSPPPPPYRGLPSARPITVGVHIRWGDTAHLFNDTTTAASSSSSSSSSSASTSEPAFYGSMSPTNIRRILHDVRAAFGRAGGPGVRVTIAMKDADPGVLAWLQPELQNGYTLLDTPDADPMADLRALSRNDILLLGESSYAVLAHLLAPPGLTIVEFPGGWNQHKYTNTSGFGRTVVFLPDYTPDCLTRGWPGDVE